MKFSVLMSIYNGEKVNYFIEAIESVLNQTVIPDEIILIRDGLVNEELQKTIDSYITKYETLFTYVPLELNKGLGNALHIGVITSRNEYIARMDSDDICVPNRFEKQLAFMKEHSEISVVGGQIYEFIEDPNKIVCQRAVPLDHDSIVDFFQTRNAFNHMTVLFKKSAVLEAGNYMDMHYVEDYYLWCRMLLHGCKFANLPDCLVYARIGNEMFKRRGGYRYFCSWKKLEKFKKDNGIIDFQRYSKTLILRFIVQVITPNTLRGFIIKKFGRVSDVQTDC